VNLGPSSRPSDSFRASRSLCESCAHVRIIRSERGSTFYMCKLAAQDARYPKYPGQPVFSCAGHVRGEPDAGARNAN